MQRRNSFGQNLLGVIGGGTAAAHMPVTMDFIPNGVNGETIKIKGDTATWMGLTNKVKQKYAYNFCFPLQAIINSIATYDTNGTIEILRLKGKGADDYATNEWAKAMGKLLAQPNPMQSWEQFRGQQVVYKKIFGYCPVLPIMPAGYTVEKNPEMALAMINLPPWNFEAIGTGKFLFQSKIEDIVKEYRVSMLGRTVTLKPSEVFILKDGFMQDELTNFLLPQSRLVGLDMAASNICYAMEADNVLLRKKGPQGVLSHDPQTDPVSGYVPMDPEEKAELENTLMKYGLGYDQFRYAVTRQGLKWVDMGFDVSELGTKATVVGGEKAICHVMQFPYVLYEDTDATYANGSNAAASVYQNNIIPGNTKDLGEYNKFFKAEENNCKITGDFSHINALQEDKLAKAQADRFTNMANDVAYKSGIITKNQWLESIGLDKIDGGDTYYVAPETDPGTTSDDENNPDNKPVKKDTVKKK